MRVAAVQFKPEKGAFADSLARLEALAEQAAQQADLVVLPEMAVTGYVFDSKWEVRGLAELAEGPTFHALAAICRRHGSWLVVGFPERAGEMLFNSALVISPRGELEFTYRKTMLFDLDTRWAEEGDSGYFSFEVAGKKVGVGICMDLNDERFLHWIAHEKLDVVAFPTNWLEQGIDVWTYWRYRLLGTRATLVAANTYGIDEGVEFCGRSAVVNVRGVLSAGPSLGEHIVTAEIE